ncbi:PREDICTED: heat shock protein 75 kDa, mitochondrial [Dufourea novaeangliae]|uniref:Heat shock protein 75 kDa, mitochondrial n=1 Tax=Dufourea novaeangliae TaxID=178035 RepID=A0A154PDV5_DUFNO|nr:PREDICTED: heat shock protein 75 kDa, mitochondrial [Dufourea novaeangliae]KZC10076.1 Heat shock protein 75 kDa, mitochondrial [Dufourea novaeangliae]
MATALRLRCAIKLGKSLSRPLSRNFEKEFLERQCRRLSVTAGSPIRCYSSQTATQTTEYHNIIKDTEKSTGEGIKHEFKSETQMLLEIVAKSLYSEKEVFVRELISNASDALEKLRYMRLSNSEVAEAIGDRSLEIHIATDKHNRTLTIQDTGIGMTREELVSNLGTIARSGSKAFLEKLKEKQDAGDTSQIIGQFGVGFYSAFMVADKVEVFTQSYNKDAEGLCWSSDGSGTFEISTAEGVQPGTKIVIHLKLDSREFSDETIINRIINKYSNFVGSPIYVNGKRANTIQPLWMLDAKHIKPLQHAEFYRFIGNCFDSPRFTLHYTTDVPLSIRALLYFPEERPGLFDLARDTSSGVSLYSRKILIKSKAENILPKWLRFVKGVVDSEDIPLNLSRELLQNSILIGKLRSVLTARVLKFLNERSQKQPEDYNKFYSDYGLFLKEGVVTSNDQKEKEAISKLLRFESSTMPAGELVTLSDYCKRIPEGQKHIYYLSAPSRTLAIQSPYYESLKKRNVEVLFCYEQYDDLVLMHLRQFKSYSLTSVEKEMREESESGKSDNLDVINQGEINNLIGYMRNILTKKAYDIKITTRLESHPCVVTVNDMSAARHFIRTQAHQMDDETRYSILQPRFEINPKHPLIKKLCQLTKTDTKLADLLIQQLFTSCMVGAGLIDDPRILLTPMNELLTLALEKY